MITRLPHQVRLPFGYVIKVRLVSDAEMRRISQDRRRCFGLWNDATKTLAIHQDLPFGEQVYTFMHELEHALADWRLWVGQDGQAVCPTKASLS